MTQPEIKTTESGAAISGPLLYDTIEALWPERDGLISSKSEEINVSGVTNVDSAGLAFLVEIYRLRVQQKRASRFINMPEQMVKIAKACGLDEVFPLTS